MLGKGSYLIMINGKLHEYSHWDQIPERFENIIRFAPDIPPGPHTPEQHLAIEQLPDIFRQFLEREHACSNARR